MKIKAVAVLFVVTQMVAFAQTDSVRLVWPSPPERTRIKHVRTISSLENLQPEKGFFAKLLGFFSGTEISQRWLVQPVGIAVAPDGRIFVADPGANGIHVINSGKKEYDFIAETKFGKFVSPVGLAFAVEGRLYVSDSQRGDIIVFNRDLEVEFQIKDSLIRPTGLKVIGVKLYVVDAGDHNVKVFDLQGKHLFSFGRRGAGEGEFNYPLQLVAHDSLFVVDALNYRIQKFDLGGRFISTFGGQGNIAGRFASPKGIALDSDGNIYVSDALMDCFQIFDPGGRLLLVVGRQGLKDGEFISPGGVTIDAHDMIYVVETMNRRIQIFQYLR